MRRTRSVVSQRISKRWKRWEAVTPTNSSYRRWLGPVIIQGAARTFTCLFLRVSDTVRLWHAMLLHSLLISPKKINSWTKLTDMLRSFELAVPFLRLVHLHRHRQKSTFKENNHSLATMYERNFNVTIYVFKFKLMRFFNKFLYFAIHEWIS